MTKATAAITPGTPPPGRYPMTMPRITTMAAASR